jgi:hypothetical protein
MKKMEIRILLISEGILLLFPLHPRRIMINPTHLEHPDRENPNLSCQELSLKTTKIKPKEKRITPYFQLFLFLPF